MECAIRIENLGKRYALGGSRRWPWSRRDSRELWALRHLDLEVGRGEILGIVGANGAGKSTLLKILARITPPSEGRAVLAGRVGSLLEVGTGFHPELSGRENVWLNGALLGMRRPEIEARFDAIVAFSEVEAFLDTPVKHYSSGMRMRLAFAVAAHLRGDILIIDEVLAVGDAAFQRRCLGKMDELAKDGRTVLFVSHNMSAVANLCQRAILLRGGRISDQGAAPEVVRRYLDALQPAVDAPELRAALEPERDAQILCARMIDARGKPSLVHALDEPFEVEIEFEARRDFASLVACCQVRTRWDEILLSSFETDIALYRDQSDSPEQPRRTGRYRARVRFPAPLLNAGEYALVLRLFEPRKQVLHELGPLAFSVSDTGSFTTRLFQTTRGGVIAVPLPWEVERLA